MKRLALFIALFLVPAYISGTAVNAQNTSSNDLSQQTRIEANQKLFPVTIDENRANEVRSACVAAQERVRVIREDFLVREETRNGIYRRIESFLSILQKRLEVQEVDTSNIDLVLANYRKDLAVYGSAVAQHSVSLNDFLAMNCVNNPSVFLSQLEAVRASHDILRNEVLRISKIISTDVPSVIVTNIERVKSTNQTELGL